MAKFAFKKDWSFKRGSEHSQSNRVEWFERGKQIACWGKLRKLAESFMGKRGKRNRIAQKNLRRRVRKKRKLKEIVNGVKITLI